MPIKQNSKRKITKLYCIRGAKRNMRTEMKIPAGHGLKRAVSRKVILSGVVSILFFTFTREESGV
jgi:hypothetical protein